MNILQTFERDEKVMDFEPLMPKAFEAGIPAVGEELKTVDIKALADGE